jgi:alkylation response protein AidB-like acyl-CoA dehydrogenase
VFNREGWRRCAGFGIHGLPFPAEYGGSEADIITTMMAMEGLGKGCRDAGLLFGINAQMWSIQMPLLNYGTDAQKQRYLSQLCGGELIGAHGMSEPDSGSDAFGMRTTARRDGDRYVLNGTKTFVTNAPVADLFVVFANLDPNGGVRGISAFIIERGYPGFKTGREISKLGLRTSPMAELIMEDCSVPAANLLGAEGQGAEIFNSSMEWERGCILACSLGAMERQLEACVRYAAQREQYRRPIIEFPAVADKLAEMKLRMEMARWLLYRVGWAKQRGLDTALYAAAAKVSLSEACIQSALDAVQIHGGYGFTTDYEVERDLRNSIGGKLYSGTSEIQRNIISRRLGL